MQNKKQATIITSIAIILFAATAFIFLYEPARNAIIKNNQQVELDEVTGELPILVCDYADDGVAYEKAVAIKDINTCDCIEADKLNGMCKTVVMDISFYDRALKQLDDSYCDKISTDTQKQSCIKVVGSSTKKLKEENPEYLARVYAAAHDERAIDELESVIESDAENMHAYIALALALAEKGLKEQEQGRDQTSYVNEAFKNIESAKNIDKDNSEVYRAEAYINEIKPDYEKAMMLYAKAIELDEKNILAYIGQGHTLRMLGLLEAAVKSLNEAAELDVDRKYSAIYSNLCTLEYSRSHDEAAIRNCKTVTELKGVDPVVQSDALQVMSEIFIKNNDVIQAKNYLLKAKTLTPNEPNVYVAFSRMNFFDQKFIQAEVDAKKAIKLSPTKATSYLALANARYMQDKYDDAIDEAQEGIVLVKNDVSLLKSSKAVIERDLNYVIAYSYRQLGNIDEYEKYKEEAANAFENINHLVEKK